MSYSEGEDAESAPAPHLKFMAIDSLGAPIVPIASRSPAFSPSFSPAPPLSRKRNISTVDTSTSTEPDLLHRAEAIALPIAPLPKRRRIVRDLGHVTLGFGLGVVAAVAGLSALSGAIQAMDV